MNLKSIVLRIAAAVLFTASGLVYALAPSNSEAGRSGFSVRNLNGGNIKSDGTVSRDTAGGNDGAASRDTAGGNDGAASYDTATGNDDVVSRGTIDGNDDPASNSNGTETENTMESDTGTVTYDLVDINSADAALLDTLPGIGPSKAEAIISYREEHGPFNKTEDLMNVPGIKEGTYNKLKDLICCR